MAHEGTLVWRIQVCLSPGLQGTYTVSSTDRVLVIVIMAPTNYWIDTFKKHFSKLSEIINVLTLE